MRTNKQKKSQDTNQNGSFSFDYNAYVYPQDKHIILDEIENATEVYSKYTKEYGSIYYKNVCASFDTETTSMYDENGNKIAFMYIWMFSVNGKVITGRNWDSFIHLYQDISKIIDLQHRLIVYVHNLGFDFQFFCRLIPWEKTFCAKVREPIYAISQCGMEFRDSLILTGKSLANSAKDLNKYKIMKLVGDLDYTKIRGEKTHLTKEEMNYCIYDCLVLDAIIQEKIEQEGNICKIPLTNTGYVRRYIKQKCYPGSHKKRNSETKQAENYRNLMSKLTIEPWEYSILKRAFMGGFTHANSMYVDQTLVGNIDSIDFTSSYPAVILSEMFPMSKGKYHKDIDFETFVDLYKNQLLIFDVKINNIRPKKNRYENYLSVNKCVGQNIVENNGRVVRADYIVTTTTNVDFSIIKNFYDYDDLQIANVISYEKGYLPKPIIESVLEFYKGKTELKGVEGSEVDYQLKKGMLNAIYGCMVTDIVKPVVEFNNMDWQVNEVNLTEIIDHYNKGKNRFLFYPWGVFITAYARRNLFMGISEFGSDYIYSDTDSIKCFNIEDHMDFINWYNESITRKIDQVLTFYNIDTSESRPKNKKGSEKQIGVWDWETKDEKYTKFKTLGAKRYIYTQNDELHITIAGLSKKTGCEYISENGDYDMFTEDMYIPKEHTGKMLHTYIDIPIKGDIIDYEGEVNHYSELGAVHLEPIDFTMSLSSKFKDYLNQSTDKIGVM